MTFDSVHSTAQSEAEKQAERHLLELKFIRPSKRNKVAESLRQTRSTWPNSLTTLALLVHELRQFNFPAALALKNEHEILSAVPRKIKLLWAQTEQAANRHTQAIQTLEAVESVGNDVELLRLKSLVQLKDTEAAMLLCRKLYDAHQDNAEFLSLLAQTEVLRDQRKTAKTWFRKAITVDPTDSSNFYKLAAMLHEENDYPSALTIIERGLKLNATDPTLFELQGAVYYDMEKKVQAARSWNASLSADRKQFSVYARIFRLALENGDRNSARLILKRGQANLPNDLRWATLEALLKRRRK